MGFGDSNGMILCIEEGGHVAIEALQDSPCAATSAQVIKDNHTGPCVDILISAHGSGNIAVKTQRGFQQADMPVYFAEPFTLAVFVTPHTHKFFQKSFVEQNFTLNLLRSVILLT